MNQVEISDYLPTKEFSYTPGMRVKGKPSDNAGGAAPPMDEVRALIRDLSRDRHVSLQSLSKQLGRGNSYMFDFLQKGTPAKLDEDDRRRLAAILSVDEARLRHDAPAGDVVPTMFPPSNAEIGGPAHLVAVKAYGHAVGGRDGEFVLNGNEAGEILAPSVLAGVREAYAVYVAGTSMENRYFAGEAVFVNPRQGVRRNDFVVAQIFKGEGEPPYAYVKQFVSMDAHDLKLRQFNPEKVIRFPRNKVVSVHKIVGSGMP